MNAASASAVAIDSTANPVDQPNLIRPQQPRMRHKAHHGRHRRDAQQRVEWRLAGEHLSPERDDDGNEHASHALPYGTPPAPPLKRTPSVACNPDTDEDVLWYIARSAPELRRWLVANPRSTPQLLEYVAQAGGPGVHEAIEVLLDLLERQQQRR